jgi:hypothetical protein
MQSELNSARRVLRVVSVHRSESQGQPPAPRSLRHLDGLVDDFFASGRASKKRGAREVLGLMLDACHAERQAFGGWWPIRACIEVYTYGPLDCGWGQASALRFMGSFFRYAHERDALSPRELLWLLCMLEEARRGRGHQPHVVKLPDTPAFREARLVWARCEASVLAERAGKATGQSKQATQEMVEPLCLAAELLAAEDGVPLRFEVLDPEAYYEKALSHARAHGRTNAERHVRFCTLPTLASTVERMAHAHAIDPESAAELAAALHALASPAQTMHAE